MSSPRLDTAAARLLEQEPFLRRFAQTDNPKHALKLAVAEGWDAHALATTLYQDGVNNTVVSVELLGQCLGSHSPIGQQLAKEYVVWCVGTCVRVAGGRACVVCGSYSC
jgi:hypothetical protein